MSKDQGTYHAPAVETVAAYMDAWLALQERTGEHRARTAHYSRETVVAYVVPVIGSMRLGDVRPGHVQSVVDAMLAGKRCKGAPSTVLRRYGVLRAALADAVASDRIAVTPCRGIALPKLTRDKLRPPSPAEVGRILEAAGAYRVPLTLAAWTGLRRGEVLGLRWSDVDLDAGMLTVRQAASYVGREVTFDRPKSRDSERSVPLAPQVVAILREAKREQATRRLRIGEGWRNLDLVVDNGDGSAMHPERLSKAFRRLTGDLGLKVRLHDLRHAAVTVQLAAGVPLAIVSEVAGHASVSFTDSRYGHLQPDHLGHQRRGLACRRLERIDRHAPDTSDSARLRPSAPRGQHDSTSAAPRADHCRRKGLRPGC